MKRFWEMAVAVPLGEGWTIELDGRPVRTPARNALVLPGEKLAHAVAEEWKDADEKVDPRAMPLTGLANAAIDRIASAHKAFADELADFGENELCCYRADFPEILVARQAEAWDPLLDWAADRYDIAFSTTDGVMPCEQPSATIDTLREAVRAEPPFILAGLGPLVRGGGSLVAALAVRHGEVEPQAAWEAVELDHIFQVEQWGADEEAEKAVAARREDFMGGARFLSLL